MLAERLRSIDDLVANFDFQPGVTPLSTWHTPAVTVAAYLTVVCLAKAFVAKFGTFKQALKPVVIAHNLLLSSGSGMLLLALANELHLGYRASGGGWHGVWNVWCDEPPRDFTTGRLYFIYYVNYMLKFYELLDTLLMILRNAPTPFLHVYHHAATLVLCWSQLHEKSTTQWVPIIINLAVHVVMYYYYAMATLGVKVWWKRHLTTFQILQFVIDVAVCSLATVLKLAWMDGRVWGADCGGTLAAGYFGTGLLFSYLLLFINFFLCNYILKQVRAKPKAAERWGAGDTQDAPPPPRLS
eukprot:CAMPEP_0118928726 /NCGR_PEP_ID=MMETSP1169-20130426/5909_1 /TAXON_ID=36882 /ORGANISM="Pyramimonas obovata, Strain CCMP722" /LENGTH=297 /DNA_ID=CAMNT_0006870771 /DNA_START=283 /DNA_END=1177 /DNA_ORIENTATION=-